MPMHAPHPRIWIVAALLLGAGLACNIRVSTAHFENVKLYKDANGETVSRTFDPTDTIYIQGQTKATANTPAKLVLIAVPDTIVYSEERQVGSGPFTSVVAPPEGGWTVGEYSLELYIDGDRQQTITFHIR